ncbi:MAG: single-stranded DNA-binding protein [Candidatus Peribacteraceae bacterium]
MKSVNKVILLGNVTRDPELKQTTGGQSVCTFGLATNRIWKDANGEKQSLAEYHNVVSWGGLAEFCGQYVQKGKPLFIEGYLKTRSWDGPEGTKIFRTEVVAENVVLLGQKESGSGERADTWNQDDAQPDTAVPEEGIVLP